MLKITKKDSGFGGNMAYQPVLGKSIKQQLEQREEEILSPFAALSRASRGRMVPEEEDAGDIRLCFQRDRDRIIHSKTFRRLKHKTQVFLSPTGDHYRTRLTHVLEVAQIAKTVAAALCLNEPLTEAIALGHDLGHTPFGHAGENTLSLLHPKGFRHYIHSLRVVDVLENAGRGLNLSFEVRNGIVRHSKGRGDILPKSTKSLAFTLEGQIVRLADIIAYVNHDMDDALRAGILCRGDLPQYIRDIVGDQHSQRIGTMVRDLIVETLRGNDGNLHVSNSMLDAIDEMRTFLFDNVYRSDQVHVEFEKASRIITDLYNYFLENGIIRCRDGGLCREEKPHEWKDEAVAHRCVCDYVAGMTDRYALSLYEQIFLPQPWGSRSRGGGFLD